MQKSHDFSPLKLRLFPPLCTQNSKKYLETKLVFLGATVTCEQFTCNSSQVCLSCFPTSIYYFAMVASVIQGSKLNLFWKRPFGEFKSQIGCQKQSFQREKYGSFMQHLMKLLASVKLDQKKKRNVFLVAFEAKIVAAQSNTVNHIFQEP